MQDMKSNKYKLCVGPIVGLVTNNCVNILLEFDSDITELKCILVNISNSNKPVFEVNKSSTFSSIMNFKKNVPKVIKFTNLPEKSIIEFYIIDERVEDCNKYRARWHTFCSSNNSQFNTVVLNSSYPYDANQWNNGNNLLQHMYTRLSNKFDLVDLTLHLGGQVDLCLALNNFLSNSTAVTIAKKLSDPELCNYIKELFRECYRKQWNLPYIKEVLSMTQNIMFRGKNEMLITYDMSKWNSVMNKNINLIKLAHDVYSEYHCSLREDKKCFKWNKYGLFLFDAYCKYKHQLSNLHEFMHDSSIEVIMFSSNSPFAMCGTLGKNYTGTEAGIKKTFNSELTETDKSSNTQWPTENKNMYYVFKYLEKWQRVNKNKKILSLSTCDCESMSGSKLYITNKNAQHSLSQYSFGPMFGSKPTSFPQDNLQYKKWSIRQKSMDCNNYGIIKFSKKDDSYVISIETITDKKSCNDDNEECRQTINEFKSTMNKYSSYFYDKPDEENVQDYLMLENAKKTPYKKKVIKIIDKTIGTETPNVQFVEKNASESGMSTPSDVISMGSVGSKMSETPVIPSNARKLMLGDQTENTKTEASQRSLESHVMDDNEYKNVLQRLENEFGVNSDTKNMTEEPTLTNPKSNEKLQNDINDIIKQLQDSRMTNANKQSTDKTSSETDKEVDVVLNTIQRGGKTPKYILV